MHKKLKQSFIAFIPAIAWFITSFILLTLPGSDIPKYNFLEKIYFDKSEENNDRITTNAFLITNLLSFFLGKFLEKTIHLD